ncbi:GyrI-like domain-containing protein [Pseudarthrobacter sulfonivorans]|uniref:GyrI-like domain-containing protein n=1 Tax=Pseudarthrobacter sulfonivorans TaxID=121292 RepID=UPI0021071B61|nr:GyrI-like domain-containing protein [Pseudarthrobacter sulfonivorans]
MSGAVHFTGEPAEIHWTPQPTAVVRETVAMGALSDFFSRAFGAVMAETQRQNVQLAGPPFALYRGMPTETVDVEAGFPIAGGLSDTETVATGTLPETDAFEAIHTGLYERLGEAYSAIQERIRAAGKTPSGTMWEFYLNGPPAETDPSKWQTRIVWPVL